ncbi:hypothetical protein HanXRQr2_Chr13g0579731 [Helianthus annuus]|uniref:Uncharacterized protein n=1 Tax=Helianthus annuus TaxID=4232 RepID=A0A9K3EGA5_HELAN|nr:hypothetical protein HanXRQr2_Chr13g0579731 [Helianthus annuus]KAJ0848476.1 hypothetical protein HanPSC8_Chr13g0557921 [Helianthus annuus]
MLDLAVEYIKELHNQVELKTDPVRCRKRCNEAVRCQKQYNVVSIGEVDFEVEVIFYLCT